MSGPLVPVSTVRQYAYNAGFRGLAQEIIVAIALAETGGTLNPRARNVNTNGSIDRGILQINNQAWPNVSDAQADDPQTAFNIAYSRISDRGRNFRPWATFTSGAYLHWFANGTPGLGATAGGNVTGGGSGGSVAGSVGSVVVGGAGTAIGGLVPGGGAAAGPIGSGANAVGTGIDYATHPDKLAQLSANLMSGAVTNMLKWALPHLVLLGGAALCLYLALKQIGIAPEVVPVPV